MTLRILLPLILGATAAATTASDEDGFLPVESHLVSLARLPAALMGTGPACVVRLAPSGRAMMLYRGRLVALAEQPGDPLANWTPPIDTEPIRDFCWLDGQTLALLRETGLDFIRDGKPVRGVTLPARGLRLARADAAHCYLFGGESGLQKHEVLLFGVDGSVRNLFRAPQPVTAVAGDGNYTFAAVGPVVYLLTRGAEPKAVFRERADITDLAYAPPVGVFYLTKDGVGCMDGVASGLVFLQRETASLDSRSERLLLMTKDRKILLITPVSGFSRVIKDVRKLATEEQEAGSPPRPKPDE